jgi:hypothetical protein
MYAITGTLNESLDSSVGVLTRLFLDDLEMDVRFQAGARFIILSAEPRPEARGAQPASCAMGPFLLRCSYWGVKVATSVHAVSRLIATGAALSLIRTSSWCCA